MPIHNSSTIHPNAVIDEKAIIGKNCKIGPFCYVSSEVVLDVFGLLLIRLLIIP